MSSPPEGGLDVASPVGASADDAVETELRRQIKTLSEVLWEQRCTEPEINRWLENFTGAEVESSTERLHALHLLSHVSYFGLRELRVLLKSLYRDLYRYPIIQEIRAANSGTRDAQLVRKQFQEVQLRTRFLGMGNPAESGTHLLYYFRQENVLPKSLFVNYHDLLTGSLRRDDTRLAIPDLQRLVLIDDLCGSGTQASSYSRTMIGDLRGVAARSGVDLHVSYFALFAFHSGLEYVSQNADFDQVEAVHVLDETYQTFAPDSRVYRNCPPGIDATTGERVALSYGTILWPPHPLGFDDGQLLLAFHHNTPDNTLPIIWWDEDPSGWYPVLKRYHKVY